MELRREDFINQYPPLNHMTKNEVDGIWQKNCFHLYVHIPFCIRKCGFCYYKSVSIGKKGVPKEYVEALKKEILSYAAMPEIQSKKMRSLYLGGGTPTQLSERQLESILKLITENFSFTPDFEFCSEARPGDETTLSKLEILKSFGIKRLSIGCQSLDEGILKLNNCNHGVSEFYTVFEFARKVGIRTINTDLLSGLVNQSFDSFMKTMDGIIKLQPENISIYKMEVYLNSDLFRKLREGSIKLISDEEEVVHIRKAYQKILDSGYLLADHFSFLTDPVHDHIHRRGQWCGEDQLGIGASSYSRINSHLFQKEARVELYIEKMNLGEIPVVRAHKITQRERMTQRAVLGLKNLKISRIKFYEEFGEDIMNIFSEQLKSLETSGFINIYQDRIESTFEGAIFADDIARELYLPEHKAMMLGHVKRSSEVHTINA